MEYKMKKHKSKTALLNEGWRYSSTFSDQDSDVYTYRFPVHKYGSCYTLECELMLFQNTGEVRIDVFDYGTRNVYAHWYCRDYGNSKTFIKQIDEKIKQKAKTLGVVKIGNDNSGKGLRTVPTQYHSRRQKKTNS